jgi:LuxR family maltose regulon positive regulatory protein
MHYAWQAGVHICKQTFRTAPFPPVLRHVRRSFSVVESLQSEEGSPSHPAPQPLIDPLTNRELNVLELLAQRLQNKEIAEKLFISATTVKGHLRYIYGKLNVSKRREAVEKAQKIGILSGGIKDPRNDY